MHRFTLLIIGLLLFAIPQLAVAQFAPFDTSEEGIRAAQAANAARHNRFLVLCAQAEALLIDNNSAKAIPLLEQAFDLNPDFTPVSLGDLYIQLKRPADALRVLRPLVYSHSFVFNNGGGDLATNMKYVLALLDMNQWAEAVSVYERTVRGPVRWELPVSLINSRQPHYLPTVHFSPDVLNEPGLRAQAHLIIGSRCPIMGVAALDEQKGYLFMLDHLQQTLRSDRHSLDAQFLTGAVLGLLECYDEAKNAFDTAIKNTPKDDRARMEAEVQSALELQAVWKKTKRTYRKKKPIPPSEYAHLGEPIIVKPGEF